MTTDEVKAQLKPCPFCGAIPKVVDNGNTTPSKFILMHECGIGHWHTPGFQPAKPLIAAWNTRHVESNKPAENAIAPKRDWIVDKFGTEP